MKGGVKSNGAWFERKDSKLKYLQRSKPANVSIFEFLANGCFETDWQSYCVSRINGFSCGYWLEPEDLVAMPWQKTNKANDSLEFEDECYPNASGIKSSHLQLIINLFLIIFIVFVFMVNLSTLATMRKLGFIYLPICHYFTYICLFEQFDFFVISVDWFLSSFTKYRLILILELMSPSSCQMIHMVFSTCRHIISAMIIGMSIDLWRFVHGSVYFLANYRSEWVKNVFILCMVIVCTINCQFFWTFDLNKGENKFIHGRMLSNYLECDFSNTLPLNQVFTKYIWPLSDHFLAEIFPIIACMFSAIVSLTVIRRKFSLKYPINLSKVLINAPFVLQLTRSLIGFLVLNVVTNFLPRIIYVATKVILQMDSSNTGNRKTSSSGLPDKRPFVSQKEDILGQVLMVGFGHYIKYQLPFNILIRFFYFSILLKEFRCTSLRFLSIFKRMVPVDRNMVGSNPTEQLVTNSSLDKELILKDDSTIEENKRKSLLVEIYC